MVFCLHVCSTLGGQRVLDSLEQELEMTVSCCVIAGTEHPHMEESSVLLTALALYSERNFRLRKNFRINNENFFGHLLFKV